MYTYALTLVSAYLLSPLICTLALNVGLVGMPNAGKSSFLSAITNARPKIASYAFTTIVPNLGVCHVGGGQEMGGDAMMIADIPGLVEGASNGTGLGRGFLRHIERCSMILHIIDGNSQDPVRKFNTINRELQLFSPLLASKPQVVIVNKIDLPHVEKNLDRIRQELLRAMPHSRLLVMSTANRIGVEEVVSRTHKFLLKLKREEVATRKDNDVSRQ